MSRRDTIIIAVLVNAGLLLVLFAVAMPSKEDNAAVEKAPVVAVAPQQEVSSDQVLAVQTSADSAGQPVDEIDQVLSAWNEQASAVSGEVVAFNEEAAKVEESVVASAEAPLSLDGEFSEVVVKKGDALDKIARSHKTTTDAIMQLNALSSTKLKIGQVLKVPGKALKKAKKAAKAVASAAGSYTVKSGDNPWTIASKNNMKVEDLLKLNNLDEKKAKKLKPGDKLKIN